jgi:hypothetical protein
MNRQPRSPGEEHMIVGDGFHDKRSLLENKLLLLGGCFAKNHINDIEGHQSPAEAEYRYVSELKK